MYITDVHICTVHTHTLIKLIYKLELKPSTQFTVKL